jgi:DNA-binding PadR family transcriptional regulator
MRTIKKRISEPAQRKHWALAVLGLLREREMHPYEMRQLMRERHKDDRLGMKPGSLYHAIAWLEQNALIESVETSRHGNRPERTIYRITKTGEEALLNWLRELLAAPAKEPSSFAVALDHAVHLTPVETAELLEKRALLLDPRLKEMDYTLEAITPKAGRVNLLEIEFEQVLCRAELAWIRELVADLRSGGLTWDLEQILGYLRSAAPKTSAGSETIASSVVPAQ